MLMSQALKASSAPPATTGTRYVPSSLIRVKVRTVRAEQPGRFLDDAIEDHVRLAQGRDVGRDIAQGAFGVGASGDDGLRFLEGLDQPRVRERDGRLVGECAEDRLVHVIEGIRPVAPDLDRPERPGLADDRGRR